MVRPPREDAFQALWLRAKDSLNHHCAEKRFYPNHDGCDRCDRNYVSDRYLIRVKRTKWKTECQTCPGVLMCIAHGLGHYWTIEHILCKKCGYTLGYTTVFRRY